MALYPIKKIKVGKRFRKDLGDIDALAKDIADVGLLHAIVIRQNGLLVCGQRRLEACKKLGWKEIPVRIYEKEVKVDEAVGKSRAQ